MLFNSGWIVTCHSINKKYPMEKLPEEFKKKWLESLRSGEYKQGTDIMYSKYSDGYCCLGVAGAICGASKEQMDRGYFDKDTDDDIPVEYPDLLLNADLRSTLICMNDTDQKSFSEIADWIEENL